MKAEIRRQSIHLIFGSIFLILILLLGVSTAFEIILACFLLGIIISLLLVKGVHIPLIYSIVREVEREHEKEWPGKGAILFFLAAIIVILVFQELFIVVGALSVLVYGDSIATIIGLKFGKHRLIGKRSIEGTIAGIVASLPFLIAIFPVHVALSAAVIGMLAELLPVNDNFTIPIAAALFLKLFG
ncbi:MAG: hypothetical protein JW772_04215 [Candidatus Diapherotrites archaeon]|nr:hypothetical protein [Candidatus Diapherotrites archaeon]